MKNFMEAYFLSSPPQIMIRKNMGTRVNSQNT